MRRLGGSPTDYVFRSRTGSPVNPGNALKRYIRPVAEELGIAVSGWHDFRHTLATKLLREGHSPRLVSDILGNSVEMLLKVYEHPKVADFREPLERCYQSVTKTASSATAGL